MMKCPFCGEVSFAKKKNIMEGWKLVKSVEVCALCGKTLPEKAPGSATETPEVSRRAGLAALLGGDETERVILSGTADRDFCRNCINFIEHPFQTLCGLSGNAADPMGSCPDFKEK